MSSYRASSIKPYLSWNKIDMSKNVSSGNPWNFQTTRKLWNYSLSSLMGYLEFQMMNHNSQRSAFVRIYVFAYTFSQIFYFHHIHVRLMSVFMPKLQNLCVVLGDVLVKCNAMLCMYKLSTNYWQQWETYSHYILIFFVSTITNPDLEIFIKSHCCWFIQLKILFPSIIV